MTNVKDLDKLVVDTNVLIDTPEVLLDGSYNYVIPYKVLSELDGLKKNVNLSYAVRNAIKIIYQQMKANKVEITDVPDLSQTPDEIIIDSAKKLECALLTQDIGAMAVARSKNVPVIEDDDDVDLDGYTGYIEVTADISYENYVPLKEMLLEELEVMFNISVPINGYLIINRLSGKQDIWKYVREFDSKTNEEVRKAKRVSQSAKPFKDAGVMITPIDAYQMVAWDSVISDVPLTILEGKVGSSKTLSALVGLLACTIGQKRLKKFSKIYYSRAPIPVDKSLELGFMPGTMDEKALQWIAGISSNLKFLFGEEKGGEILNEHFEFVSLESIQGLSLQEDEALLIDEYQFLSRDMLQQALSRVGQNGKVILAGDPASQTYGINRSREGFKVLQKEFGKTNFISYVQLNNIYRSELVEYIDNLFNGSK